MLKALNCPPLEWAADDVRAFAAQPGHADAIITWTPWPWRNDTQDDAQALTDSSIQWARSIRKPVYICLPSPGLPPSISEWEAWVQECAGRYSRCTLIATNEPMNGGAINAQEVAAMSKTAAELAARAGHHRLLIGATDNWQQSVSVIEALHGWTPPRLTGWRGRLLRERLEVIYAHHHYNDVTYHGGDPVEVRRILAALDDPAWRCSRNVWLSEGGYRFVTVQLSGAPYPADCAYHAYSNLGLDESRQFINLTRHYQWCKQCHRIAGWANYEVRDWLWGGWASGLVRAQNGPPGQTWTDGPHPIADHWGRL